MVDKGQSARGCCWVVGGGGSKEKTVDVLYRGVLVFRGRVGSGLLGSGGKINFAKIRD